MLGRIMRVLREELPDALSPRYWYHQFLRWKIHRVCIGYSGRRHWRFWKELLYWRRPRKMLILGVYFGRDIAYLLELRKQTGSICEIVGVDKFEDRFCDDWPEDLRGKNWAEAGFGKAPSLQAANRNLSRLGHDLSCVRLVSSRAEDFLRESDEQFDFIYIDTAHDYQSTVEIIGLCMPRLAPGGLIGGDDFSDQGTWGVVTAVKECFSRFTTFGNSQIWMAEGLDWKGAPPPA
ncbi:MAG: class I SAM-dependent methyltransferase [Candidatus Eremiobacteraeota bacterium]|nr:class I SAM-dependent methyltransferase [Candidatus Eremiobacteraeota bacterium]